MLRSSDSRLFGARRLAGVDAVRGALGLAALLVRVVRGPRHVEIGHFLVNRRQGCCGADVFEDLVLGFGVFVRLLEGSWLFYRLVEGEGFARLFGWGTRVVLCVVGQFGRGCVCAVSVLALEHDVAFGKLHFLQKEH